MLFCLYFPSPSLLSTMFNELCSCNFFTLLTTWVDSKNTIMFIPLCFCFYSPIGLCEIQCRYRGCEPLVLSCPSCLCSFNCPPLISSICSIIRHKPTDLDLGSNFWLKLSCPKCPEDGDKGRMSPALLANQVISCLTLESHIFRRFKDRQTNGKFSILFHQWFSR